MKMKNKGKRLISLLLCLVMILGIAPITAFAEDIQITKIEVTYDAPVSPMYTHEEWNTEYVKTMAVGTGTVLKNKSTSNYHLMIYDGNQYYHTTNINSPAGYTPNDYINPEYAYYISTSAYADTGYYFDTENLNNIEIWVNGVKCDGAFINYYNDYWNSVDIFIPASVDTSSIVRSITISQDGDSVTVGTTKQFSKSVKYYGTGYDEVIWQVSGATSAETAIDSNGLLTVGEDETATSLKIKAISAMDSSISSNELTVYVQEKPLSIDSVSVSPASQSVFKAYSGKFTASVEGTASHAVEWSIIGTTTDENTKITASGTDNLTGTLQIGANETATSLTVRATSVADDTKYAEATVSILDQIQITKIEITYDTERAPLSSELTHGEWNTEYVKTMAVGTGTVLKNKSTSNYHLMIYDGNQYYHTTNINSPAGYTPNDYINPEYAYFVKCDAFADTGYYFDTENLNDIEIWVNGKKYDNVIIQGYNESWNSIGLYIPVSEKALCSHSFTDEIKSEETLAKAGTCAAEAEYYYTCSKCEMIEKSLAHTFKGDKDLTNHIGKTHIENAVEPDYENYVDGYTGDKVCNGCNKILEYGTPIIVTKPTPPAKVTGLKTSARGANGVNLTLSWNAVDGATGYNVYGYNKPADSWTLLDTVTTNKFISPTTPGYEYYFRVAAVNGDVEGTPSDALHTCAACETMDAPSVIASNDKTIQVDWNLVGSHGYVVMWSKDASFKTGVSSKYITGHSKSNYTISVPSGASQYYVRVRAWRNWETGYVYGSWSEGVKAGQTIAKVTGLKTSARGANGVNLTISWDAQAAADSYNVYGYNKANASWTLLGNVTTNKYISPTTPGYEYIFRVAAVEDGREGVPSERLHTCAACETMKAPTVQKNGSQIKVNWEIVGSHGYVVMWSTDPTFKTGVSSKYITGHSVSNYTITGINSNQTYYVRVRAWRNWDTGYVYGSWSTGTAAK